MVKKYPQLLVDDLFEEGDRDYHFLNEFLGFVGNIYPEPYMKNRINLNKNADQELTDALSFANFFISSGAYVGVYMKEYDKFDKIFDNPKAFDEFISSLAENDMNFLKRINSEDRYTIGLMKVQRGAKAPPITHEIEEIFRQGSRVE